MTIRLEEIVYLHCHQQGRDHGDRRWLDIHCGSLSPLPAPCHTPFIHLSVPGLNHCDHPVMGDGEWGGEGHHTAIYEITLNVG